MLISSVKIRVQFRRNFEWEFSSVSKRVSKLQREEKERQKGDGMTYKKIE